MSRLLEGSWKGSARRCTHASRSASRGLRHASTCATKRPFSAITLLEEQRGAAYVEFLLAFIPLFFLFLGMVQMALMYAGNLVVQHSATTAARAAAVGIDDDPRFYGGAERMTVSSFGITSTEDAIGALLSIFGGGGAGEGSTGIGTSPDGPRMDAIRRAASIPLLAISPSMGQLIDSDSVRTAIGAPESRALTGLTLYNSAAMAVTFPEAPGSTNYRTDFSPGDQIVTRVTYLFHCGVPVVNRLMCETYPSLRLGPAAAMIEGIVRDLGSGNLSFDDAMERLRRVDVSRRRHERDQDGIRELEAAPSDDLMYLTWATGARFKVIRAEAAMPLQHASYLYQGAD